MKHFFCWSYGFFIDYKTCHKIVKAMYSKTGYKELPFGMIKSGVTHLKCTHCKRHNAMCDIIIEEEKAEAERKRLLEEAYSRAEAEVDAKLADAAKAKEDATQSDED